MKVRFQPSYSKKKAPFLTFLSVRYFVEGIGSARVLVGCMIGLIIFGWVMVYSSSALIAGSRFGDQYYFLKRQIAWSAIGVLAFLISSRIPLRVWQKSTRGIYLVTVLSLILVLFIGPDVAGARRWIRFGALGFQPSELAKLTVVLLVADYMDRHQSRIQDFKRGILPLLFLFMIPILLIFVEPDLGTPILLTTIFFFLLVAGGARWGHLTAMVLSVIPFLVFALTQFQYRVVRIFAYLDPWSDPRGAGYQLIQSLLAMGSGGIFGRGLGQSRMKVFSLPDPHTDFIFSVLGEELGLLGTIVCAGIFLFLCLRGLKIAKEAHTIFNRLMAVGLSLMIGIQALINMGVATGLVPTKGMPLPFISFGGSSLVILLIAMGILVNVSREAGRASHNG